jgi:hypothetical protein
MTAMVEAVASADGRTVASSLDVARRGRLGRLAEWIGWPEGLATFRAIAASRLRGEGYVSALIRRCDADFAHDPPLRLLLDVIGPAAKLILAGISAFRHCLKRGWRSCAKSAPGSPSSSSRQTIFCWWV